MHQMISSIYAELHFMFKQDYKYDQFLGPEGNVDVELINKSANKYRLIYLFSTYLLCALYIPGTILGDGDTSVRNSEKHDNLRYYMECSCYGKNICVYKTCSQTQPSYQSSAEAPKGSPFVLGFYKSPGQTLHSVKIKSNCTGVYDKFTIHKKPFGSEMSISKMLIPCLFCIEACLHLSILSLYHLSKTFMPLFVLISFSVCFLMFLPVIPQMIDDEEERFCGVRLQTSPPVEPLTFGAHYIVSNSAHLEIIPTELKLSYRSPGEIQPFSKFNAGQMKEPIQLEITDKRHGTLVWKTVVKPVDIQLGAASAPRTFSGAAFVRENHRQLQARIGDLKGVLDDLQDNEVLSENEKELVEQAKTRQSKTDALLSMVEKKGDRALELLFRSLSERDPYLVSYLRQQTL
ncbi:hypothetical protein EGM_09927 [Macaca fascicularis]|uniref:Caspase recruitment domain-containing protein 8 n=1 Tax=Macaca fascicularis TaxID=9541 RepID=G7PY16_MACFA|nr:hypothetical protein EGM_09927 [Macaca fascicularis]